jgi:L-fuculose-phosphate aldolase
MTNGLQIARQRVLATAQAMYHSGLVQGTSGNVSMRDEATNMVAITPSGIPYETMTTDDIVIVDLDGIVREGSCKPSSETPMHTCVYRQKPWVGGVVHTHSPFATTFAVAIRPIPAVHYLIAHIGSSIPVAPYATYGTAELATHACNAMETARAVLLQNHGVLAVAESIEQALLNASIVEYLAMLYYRVLSLGLEPMILPEKEIQRVAEKFKTYGQQPLQEG